MVRIAVVGAGVVGLTTATFLQEALPEASVTVIADRYMQDTVSDVAAGIFRPSAQFQGPTPEITRTWLDDSYKYYKDILNSDIAEEIGVKKLVGYQLSRKSPVKNPILETTVDEPRPCTKEELQELNVKYGIYFESLLTECRIYLPYLTTKFRERGGKILERHLESLEQLVDDYDLVCNCAGLGAKDLCGDPTVIPIRGQIFKVRAPWMKPARVYALDTDTYIVSGFDTVTVGGTLNFGSYNDQVSKHDSEDIWERAVGFMPSLKDAEIVTERVGLRPYRYVVRVEKELMKFDSGKTLKVVHNYGHGGNGVMTAPGTSMQAVSLAKEMLYPQSKL